MAWPARASATVSWRSTRPTPSTIEPVAGLLDVGDDVAGEQRRGAVGADRIGQDVQELATGQRVEAGQWLVEEQDRRAGAEGQGQRHLRLLPAGEDFAP